MLAMAKDGGGKCLWRDGGLVQVVGDRGVVGVGRAEVEWRW